jgi:regulatory protein
MVLPNAAFKRKPTHGSHSVGVVTTPRKPERPRREPAPADARTLERAAMHYLARYATSAEHLRRVLMRRVRRAAIAYGSDPEEGKALVEALIDRLARDGLLDDTAFAEARARTLNRRGLSQAMIARALAQKGVRGAPAEAAIAALAETFGDPDFHAAVAFARRRRIGPYRAQDARTANRERDLAALSRRGFDATTARRVIDAADPDDLERAADNTVDGVSEA